MATGQPVDLDLLAQIARTHGLRLVLQFGSTVTGREHARSDVDLAVEFVEVPREFWPLGAVMQGLQGLFPGRDVDVAMVNRADPLFLHRMLSACRLLYGDPRRLAALQIYAFKRYQDHRRFLGLERQHVARVLARMGSG
jgi:predicted nucleotidyltransferase